mgnify:CR=1 FL=1
MSASPRRIRLDLAYDGTDFFGWQEQPGLRTVQGVVAEALSRIQGGRPARVRGAGRTDAGVHARGQVADADVETPLDDGALFRALGAILPLDVRAVVLATAADEFDARRDATSKTYRYLLDRSPHGDPFLARYALHHPHPMDLDAVESALLSLPGRKDWSGFAGAAGTHESAVRDLTDARCAAEGKERLAFVFRADGFLNHMVRNLVGTLLEIARGRFPPSRIDEVLAARDRRLAGPTAPAHGLRLERVEYGPRDALGRDGSWCTIPGDR